MNAIDIINKTKLSIPLSHEEIVWLVEGYTNGEIPDHQMSAWLMAVRLNGITDEETLALTYAMRDSGGIMQLDIPYTVDKHSTGGVGDKTSLIIGPIVAACGVCMSKMSGRGLGHTGGTIDKLESIPGLRTDLSVEEFTEILNKNGFAIMSQSGEICPADKKIYALRNATGTVDSIPLICASIMSKKLATNADCLLLDVKYGTGAFMKTKEEAEKLAAIMERIGRSAGKQCRAVVTDMNEPLGCNVGNSLEVREALEVLRGETRGELYNVCIMLASELLALAGKGTVSECAELAAEAISSGKALEVMREMIKLQGGTPDVCDDLSLLPMPKFRYTIKAVCDMEITGFNCEEIGQTALMLGAGRTSLNGRIDATAGIIMQCRIGESLCAGDPIMTLCSTVCSDFSEAAIRALNAVSYIRHTQPKNDK